MHHGKTVVHAALVAGLMLVGHTARSDDALLKASLIACPSDKALIGGVNACAKVWKLGGSSDVECR
jgi:hypothetical protein